MRGTILGVDNGRGVLLGPNEQRLEFAMSEWRSPGEPQPGQAVDFVESGGEARSVFAVPGARAMGVGAPQSGAFVLSAVALGCLALGFIIPVLPTIAAFVIGAIAAHQAQAESDGNALLMARIAWIGALVLLAVGALIVLGVLALVGTMGLAAIASAPFN